MINLNLYDKMLNITNQDIESIIKTTITKTLEIIPDTTSMCKVASNLIYNDLLAKHISSKIINTKDLGLGYEHEFIITRDNNIFYLIDITYNQFLNKGTILNKELLENNYIKLDNTTLVNYLHSIPNTYKIYNIEILDIYLPNNRKK